MVHFRKKDENETELDSRRRMLHSHAVAKDSKRKRLILIISGVVLVAVVALVGVGYYQNYVTPYGRPIMSVDGHNIKMDYFLKRTKLAGTDPMNMLQLMAQEEILKEDAPQLVPDVTPADIDSTIREMANNSNQTATGDNQTAVVTSNMTDKEFKEWYRQQINESGLTDAEFRDIVRTNLLAASLQSYLAERVPTVAPQVHLYAIMTDSYDTATALKTKLDAGSDFATLANGLSSDNSTSSGDNSTQNGGEIGWIPQGVLIDELDSVAFSLEPGKVSDPIVTSDGSNYIIKVTEKVDAREIDANSLEVLKSRALEMWLTTAMQNHTIDYHNFNSETYAWINWQLSKSTSTSSNQAGK